MSAILEKSLDEIIGANKKQNRARVGGARGGRNNNGPRKVSKQINAVRRGPPGRGGRPQATRPATVSAATRVSRLLDSSREARVNVEGLPRDIKQDAVREFFASQVGGVLRVLLSYNERGNSTGMATITFKNGDMAKKAVAKFNGAPIDGGRSRLRLNLIIDPNQRPSRTLNDRIRALPQRPEVTTKRGPNKKAVAVKARKQQKQQQKKKEKPVKKSLEDLDKEMADYFEEKKE